MSVQNIVRVYLDDVEIFHRISENTDLLMALEEKSRGDRKVIRIYPLGTTNVCTKLHGGPSNSC